MVVILVRFSVLQRGMKIQGFDQIEQYSPKHEDFLQRKKNLGVRCTLMLFGVALLLPLEFFSHLLDKAFKLI